MPIEYCTNRASAAGIADHLSRTDADFVPHLSSKVEIAGYAQKIAEQATRLEAWVGGDLVGLVAVYCNDFERRVAFITSVSVLRGWQGKGIATQLVGQCIEQAKQLGFVRIELEVNEHNAAAIGIYEKFGFRHAGGAGQTGLMFINIGEGA